MPHPLVAQLRFTRSEWVRGLGDVSEEDGRRDFPPLNSIGWMVGHLAFQEQRYWLWAAQGRVLLPELDAVAPGAPRSTPSVTAMWEAWRTVTAAADEYLDTLDPEALGQHYTVGDRTLPENAGTMLLRMIYHYWYHLGEGMAVRQLLGHTDLPSFVGRMSDAAYQPDTFRP